ncbi:cell division protein ZapA [Spirosoma radiotolerans]|jgi:cell division protein ZapA (FtsZ GTPase activity inhibitor)|uniref:Cell division protein ZapA n=1 Tax=Spirosoma radiotolerans TaxID=1379870 RepID=A0A0E3V5N0_9BACT|nr:cell division protein ZapA [Spirosoma radiotolerans]AKD54322.1 cell division protein ZapA [Spirosoma radiotolerans]
MEELPIRVKIADRFYKLAVEPESEAIVREAAKLIQDELKQYRERGLSDTQEALAMIAFDCLVTKLRGERQMQRLQQMVFDKITQLDQVVTPVIST